MTFPGLLNVWPPKIPFWPPGVGWGFTKKYWFSGQFMTFPGLLNCWPPKIHPGTALGSGGSICLGSNQSHIHPNMCAKFGCGPTGVNAMLVWHSRNVRKLRHPATLATIFLERPSLGSLVVRLITGDSIGISGVKYLCVAIRSLISPLISPRPNNWSINIDQWSKVWWAWTSCLGSSISRACKWYTSSISTSTNQCFIPTLTNFQ